MRYIILLLGILLCTSKVFSQEVKDDEYDPNYIDYEDICIPTPNLFTWLREYKAAVKQDIFQYFREDLREYDTDLKKSMFIKNIKSLPFKDSLSKVTDIIINKRYKMKLNCSISDYNIKTGQFTINLNYPLPEPSINKYYPNIFDQHKFLSLPAKHMVNPKNSDDWWSIVKIKMDKKTALEIEDNKQGMEVYLIYSPFGTEKISRKWIEDGLSMAIIEEVVTVKQVRLAFVNNNSKKLYYFVDYK